MKRLAGVCCAVAVVAASSAASAAEYRGPLFPTPVAVPAPAIVGFEDHAPAAAKPADAITLYECVKVRDPHHVAPCAEVKIVKVLDPCWKPDPCACCQKPKYVYVKVCVPKKKECCPKPCCAPKPSCCAPAPKCCPKKCCEQKEKITCRHGGRYVKLDYGKYRVEIRVKKGYVEVDYDD